MKTLNDFTPEIKAKIPAYKAMAIEGIYDGKLYSNFNAKNAEAAIEWNYKQINMKAPIVLVAENPLEQQLMFNYLNTSKADAINELISKKADRELINDALVEAIKAGPKYSKADLGILKTFNNSHLFTLNVYSNCYYAWFKFIKDEFNLPLTIEAEFEECFRLQRASSVYSCIFSEEVAVVCKYPKRIFQEDSDQFRLHNKEGQAVEWGSLTGVKFDCYYILGRNIEEELFLKLKNKQYTLQDFLSEEDEEIKSACVSYLQETEGDGYLVNFFRDNLKEVDTYVDRKSEEYLEGTTKGMNVGVYTLFKGTINEVDIAYVRCYCPSTDRMFFLGVSSEHRTAKDAIASLYRVPRILKQHIKEINRQGERYSTTFTDEGTAVMKGMTKEQTEDLVSITGEEYFAKMKYEY
jgi:hypothetical protein